MTHGEIFQALLDGKTIRTGSVTVWDEWKLIDGRLHSRTWYDDRWMPTLPQDAIGMLSATSRVVAN